MFTFESHARLVAPNFDLREARPTTPPPGGAMGDITTYSLPGRRRNYGTKVERHEEYAAVTSTMACSRIRIIRCLWCTTLSHATFEQPAPIEVASLPITLGMFWLVGIVSFYA